MNQLILPLIALLAAPPDQPVKPEVGGSQRGESAPLKDIPPKAPAPGKRIHKVRRVPRPKPAPPKKQD